jgi:pyocin large subunit-like protein
MTGAWRFGVLALPALLLAGCDGGASAVKAPKSGEVASVEGGNSGGGAPAAGEVAEASAAARQAADPRDAPVRLIAGRPMWAANRTRGAEENAQRGFERFGEAFGARDVDDYVRKTHAFVAKPPAGAQTLTRSNGDTLIYDPAGNVFAVVTRAGAPRTMFKPDDGADYWRRQKEGQGRRTASSERRGQAGAD